MVEFGLEAIHLLLIALHTNGVSASGNAQFGVFTLNEFKLIVGRTKKFQMVYIRKNDLFEKQTSQKYSQRMFDNS
jgi:hypothetical protein